MTGVETAILAAVCMAINDVLGTCLVMAESAERGWLAGFLDVGMWYVSIATTTISVTALAGHDTTEKIAVLVLVGAANLLGTRLGVLTGKLILKRKGDAA